MAEIVNLRTARKQATRKAARDAGAAQAAKFGRSRAEKDLAQARAAKAERDLAAHRRERDGEND
jgi:hypothetical protein